MCATILVDPDVEQRLQRFVASCPRGGRRLEILAHAWTTVGGRLHIGARTVRLLAREGPPRTAATLHAELDGAPALEVSRVVLEQLGMSPSAWSDWCDERPELTERGFDPESKYPVVRLEGLPDTAVLRLALGLRDLYLRVGTALA